MDPSKRAGRVDSGGLCSAESVAGGSEPSQGSELNRVDSGGLCSAESVAGGSEPSQGSELNRPAVGILTPALRN
jgi:hypothetical protein